MDCTLGQEFLARESVLESCSQVQHGTFSTCIDTALSLLSINQTQSAGSRWPISNFLCDLKLEAGKRMYGLKVNMMDNVCFFDRTVSSHGGPRSWNCRAQCLRFKGTMGTFAGDLDVELLQILEVRIDAVLLGCRTERRCCYIRIEQRPRATRPY